MCLVRECWTGLHEMAMAAFESQYIDLEDIQCAGFDHDYYQEAACAHHEEHVMHDCVQLDHVVDSHDNYTSDSNIILCHQYVRDNERITPTEITDGERGFEHTKACYLQEVIPFFKTLKDNFEGIQKALTKEVKEMKDVLEELEAEVAQYAVDRKHDAIELKNLLIANDNLIAESELANLHKTNNQDNQKELINHFSKLEVSHLNLQLKYQNLKDTIGNSPPTPDKDTPDFDSVFVIGKMQAFLQGKDNVIRQLKKQLSQFQVTRSDTDRTLRVQITDSQITKLTDQVTNLINENVNLKTCVSKATVNPQVSARDTHAIDVEPIVLRLRNNKNAHLDYLRHLKESVEIIHDIVEEAKVVRPLDRSIVSAYRYTKHSQELLEYAIGTCPQGSQPQAKQLAHTPLIRKKQIYVAQPTNKLDSTDRLLFTPF
nr:integrase, catalytic region, zinc finger, CCHC-type, peptidase aspartic, catalytic [Tanacetum cinerariifolium]